MGLAAALAAASVVETLTINAYFHMIFRICLHLKASAALCAGCLHGCVWP